uniref:Vegetative incompatibility protein 3a n=1 Tax=Cryphonectria parasitica TaxID=5116 RepID=W1I7I4_CRYPA|nr:vegetative incompatibility protein 3a [Cryphonectria parasitica]
MIVFDSNCTLPNSSPGFVNGGNQRDTLDILTNSLSILILCTWSILRLNIPLQTTPQTRLQRIRKVLRGVCTKIRWMVITLLAPEVLFGKAITDLRSCALHTPLLLEFAYEDDVPWTRYHTCLADMGGFILTIPHETDEEKPTDAEPKVQGADSLPSPSDNNNNNNNNSSSSNPPVPSPEKGRCEVSLVQRQSLESSSSPADIEAGLGSPGAASKSSISSSSSSLSSTAGPTTSQEPSTGSPPSATPATPAPPTPSAAVVQRAEWLRCRLDILARYLSGQRPTEDHMRKFSEREIANAAARYGPVAWRPHAQLAATSQAVIREVTSTAGGYFLPSGKDRVTLVGNLTALEGDTIPLSAAQMLAARRTGLLDKLPYVTEDMIRDRDKSDTLVKLAAIWQVLMLMVDLISRQAAGLPSSPLEIMVLAFSVLALFIYLMNWFKPQDIEAPYYLTAARVPTHDELHQLAVLMPGQNRKRARFSNLSRPVVDDGVKAHDGTLRLWVGGAALSGMTFGGLHLLQWNFPFPTRAEVWLWRASALITSTGPPAPGVLGWFIAALRRYTSRKTIQRLVMITHTPLPLILFFARMFLLVEAYRSLYFLPPKTYLTTWTSNLPHLG